LPRITTQGHRHEAEYMLKIYPTARRSLCRHSISNSVDRGLFAVTTKKSGHLRKCKHFSSGSYSDIFTFENQFRFASESRQNHCRRL